MTVILVALIVLAGVPSHRALIAGIDNHRQLVAPACFALASLLLALIFVLLVATDQVPLDHSWHFAIVGALASLVALGMLSQRKFRGLRVGGIMTSVFLSWAIWWMLITLH